MRNKEADIGETREEALLGVQEYRHQGALQLELETGTPTSQYNWNAPFIPNSLSQLSKASSMSPRTSATCKHVLKGSKYFRGKKLNGEYEIRVEQAEFSEMNLASYVTSGCMVDMQVNKGGTRVVSSSSSSSTLLFIDASVMWSWSSQLIWSLTPSMASSLPAVTVIVNILSANSQQSSASPSPALCILIGPFDGLTECIPPDIQPALHGE
ncbi:hypothetical protein NQZ68_037707 [Dissostichus eleginoides]|nr:hypothetical protein NQZ68_037707 [Dissostichus eleginoides]